MFDSLRGSGKSSTLTGWVSRPWLPTALQGQEVQHGD
jgi:hypothetical protein